MEIIRFVWESPSAAWLWPPTPTATASGLSRCETDEVKFLFLAQNSHLVRAGLSVRGSPLLCWSWGTLPHHPDRSSKLKFFGNQNQNIGRFITGRLKIRWIISQVQWKTRTPWTVWFNPCRSHGLNLLVGFLGSRLRWGGGVEMRF